MIQWGSFFVVAAVAIVSTVVLTVFCSGGVRLLSDGHEAGSPVRVGAAYACFAVCAAAVLFGLWLVVPQFH